MISYEPFWATMKAKNKSTYFLRNKGGFDNISSSTIRRMKAGLSVSTNTLDSLCKMLECSVSDLIEYRKNPAPPEQ